MFLQVAGPFGVEGAVGVAAVIIGGWVPNLLVAASYLAFAVFVTAAMRSEASRRLKLATIQANKYHW